MAGIMKKVKQGTRKRIVHAVFGLGHEVLNALEEMYVGEEEEKPVEEPEDGDSKGNL
jgi:hypothetical protein